MRSYLKFAAALVMLGACGEGPLEPGRFTLEGSWLGRRFPFELALQLEQDDDNHVSGEGEIRSLRELLETDTISLNPLDIDTVLIDTVVAERVAVDVSGKWGYPGFVLTFSAPDFADVQYDASFGRTSPDSVSGNLLGSGFTNQTVPIVRQRSP
ncbi:MAG TPA: hypothetical protein VM759_08285 [Longimicrobium sp.]|nr:hypothetical protein [Longimicrobium sp.]